MHTPIKVLSLGAGVQSSTLALMAAKGKIPAPDFAVFADTGGEPTEVYRWLERLRSMVPFRIKIAHRDPLEGKLYDKVFEWGHSQIPAYFRNADGTIGIGKRQCTKHWKIVPVLQKIREATNTQRQHLPEGFCELQKGISTDEVSRAKDDREPWIKATFPLLDMRMSRADCRQWLNQNGIPHVPKSACFFCPYRSDSQWAASRQDRKEWEMIVELDRKLNERGEFLHPSAKPIETVKLTDSDKGQLDLFNNECEGMCGV